MYDKNSFGVRLEKIPHFNLDKTTTKKHDYVVLKIKKKGK